MTEPFMAEIRIFAGNYAPRGWAFCDGQLMQISQNTALFALLGTTYGGDGRSTFGFPDLQGRAPMHPGRGPGLTSRRLGQKIGAETESLSEEETPSHTHEHWMNAATAPTSPSPMNRWPAMHMDAGGASGRIEQAYRDNPVLNTNFSQAQIAETGGGQPHLNVQPYLAMIFIIAMVGVFPSRN